MGKTTIKNKFIPFDKRIEKDRFLKKIRAEKTKKKKIARIEAPAELKELDEIRLLMADLELGMDEINIYTDSSNKKINISDLNKKYFDITLNGEAFLESIEEEDEKRFFGKSFKRKTNKETTEKEYRPSKKLRDALKITLANKSISLKEDIWKGKSFYSVTDTYPIVNITGNAEEQELTSDYQSGNFILNEGYLSKEAFLKLSATSQTLRVIFTYKYLDKEEKEKEGKEEKTFTLSQLQQGVSGTSPLFEKKLGDNEYFSNVQMSYAWSGDYSFPNDKDKNTFLFSFEPSPKIIDMQEVNNSLNKIEVDAPYRKGFDFNTVTKAEMNIFIQESFSLPTYYVKNTVGGRKKL